MSSVEAVHPSIDQLQNVLDEGRILILGGQIILGFLYRCVFEPGYDRLPRLSQELILAALLLIVIAFILLMWPIAYHRILGGGARRPSLRRFVEKILMPALPLFALSMGLTLYVAIEKVAGRPLAIESCAASTALALFLWYGVRHESPERRHNVMDQSHGRQTLDQKIKHVLTEARMVLPGAQALLGFQFITVVLDDFDRLPQVSKEIHLISLLATALSTVFLMTPAAHHRIVEHGENSEQFHRFAGKFVLLAMIPLAAGIAGDFFVVLQKVTGSAALAAAAAAALLAVAYGLWFGVTFYKKLSASS